MGNGWREKEFLNLYALEALMELKKVRMGTQQISFRACCKLLRLLNLSSLEYEARACKEPAHPVLRACSFRR